VLSVTWSPDDLKIVSGSRDKTVQVYNAETGEVTSTFQAER
jgi:WD40 repeat protein